MPDTPLDSSGLWELAHGNQTSVNLCLGTESQKPAIRKKQ